MFGKTVVLRGYNFKWGKDAFSWGLKPYLGQIGEVRDFTCSACLVKFKDGYNQWKENGMLRKVDFRDLIRDAIEA